VVDDNTRVLQACSVSKAFGHVNALADVNFSVAPGEWVAIVGPSGSGKTTLLQLLGSLEVPDRGSILYKGTKLTALRNLSHYRRHAIGMVYQLHNLLPHLDVAGNVEVALYGSHLRGSHRADRVEEVLDQVALTAMHDRRPPELSGGERQRVAIARAICNRPEVLLADEPTGSLDPDNVKRLVALFTQLKSEENMSIVMVTHDREVARRADRVMVLSDGHLERGLSDAALDRSDGESQFDLPVPWGWDAVVP
jgi:ABC-type lipoprotein export system ATPase subunit